MKYETPELTALNAINAVQQKTSPSHKTVLGPVDSQNRLNDVMIAAYADWE